jgi:hypothetical protein
MDKDTMINFNRTKEPVKHESLKVNPKKGNIHIQVNGINFIDKDTKQFIIYIPSLDISSYGETKNKAEEMLKESFDFFCRHLVSLSTTEINKQLSALGWQKGFFAKQFSKLYVDENGQLQDFNAENNHIERFALTAA